MMQQQALGAGPKVGGIVRAGSSTAGGSSSSPSASRKKTKKDDDDPFGDVELKHI